MHLWQVGQGERGIPQLASVFWHGHLDPTEVQGCESQVGIPEEEYSVREQSASPCLLLVLSAHNFNRGTALDK